MFKTLSWLKSVFVQIDEDILKMPEQVPIDEVTEAK